MLSRYLCDQRHPWVCSVVIDKFRICSGGKFSSNRCPVCSQRFFMIQINHNYFSAGLIKEQHVEKVAIRKLLAQ